MTSFHYLLGLLKIALNIREMSSETVDEELSKLLVDVDSRKWSEITTFATTNSVAGLLYDLWERIPDIPEECKKILTDYSRIIAKSNYRMLVINKQLTEVLGKAGISFCIMKGLAAARDFPVPDLRKSGDIDILITDVNSADKAVQEIGKLGFRRESEQHSLHHISMSDSTGLEIEVHTMLAEPFDNSKINGYLEKLVPECRKHIIKKDIMDVNLPVLEDSYHAYELLLHMLQHFLRSGFGVKLLCDWVVLWNRGLSEEDRQQYLKLVTESGIKGFSDMVTITCIKYLGLKRENVLWMSPFDGRKNRKEQEEEIELFLEELMDAGEFGKAKERMVALRGNGIFDYVREFHHQMHLNFPKAGKIFLFWPVLWIITLVRFLRNNRKVRGVSSKDLLKSAGKRAKHVKGLHLFE